MKPSKVKEVVELVSCSNFKVPPRHIYRYNCVEQTIKPDPINPKPEASIAGVTAILVAITHSLCSIIITWSIFVGDFGKTLIKGLFQILTR